MALALSAKAFSVSTPSVWNSLAYNCSLAQLASAFQHMLKTEMYNTTYSEHYD